MPYLDKIGLGTLWNKIKETFQVKLVSGTNIKTINNTSLLGSGNISLTASDVGAVPTSRKVNNKALSSDISLSASDVSAVPTTRTVNGKALSANITLSASDVGALPLSGGTMTGQLKTSFKESVATGSYGSAQSTVDGLVGEVRFSSGCMGSASIGTAYTKNGITIGTGWYNFIYSPHRSGGANGAASGDNCNYGNLVLMGMTVSGSYLIRVNSASISEVRELANYGDTAWKTLTTDFNYIKRGGIVFVDFYKTNQSLSTSWTTIGTLPDGYRPSHNIYGPAMSLGTPQIAYFINRSSGVVQMRTNSGSGSYVTAFNISFPVL